MLAEKGNKGSSLHWKKRVIGTGKRIIERASKSKLHQPSAFIKVEYRSLDLTVVGQQLRQPPPCLSEPIYLNRY
jgi:hypothetical protein